MPHIPKSHRRKWQNLKRKPNPDKDNSKHYKSRAHQKRREALLYEHPFCQICEHHGADTPSRVLEHLIPISEGGSKNDPRNHMMVCDTHANKKRGKERHKSILIAYVSIGGEKIPANPEDIFKVIGPA